MNETEQLLELLNRTFPDIASMPALEARELVDSRIRPAKNVADAVSEDLVIDTPAGQLQIRIYRQVINSSDPKLPITIYAHGGGFLHGSIDGHDGFCRRWSKSTGMTVISVNYRLAPEWGAPAPAEDLMTTAQWALAEGIGERIIFAGDSSGANAAAVAASTLVQNPDHTIAGQVLITPFLDPSMHHASHVSRAEGYFITNKILTAYWSHYLSAPGTKNAQPWQVNPTLAPELKLLPPSIIVTAGLDPLADEGRAYFDAIQEEGVTAIHRHYSDQFHGFFTIADYGPAASANDILWADISRLIISTETQV